MTERERCLVCDFPLATEADLSTLQSLDHNPVCCAGRDCHFDEEHFGQKLCWNMFWGGHPGPAIDWRARALKAEKELRYLRRHFVCQCDTSYTARDRHAPECMAYELADLDAVLDEVTR